MTEPNKAAERLAKIVYVDLDVEVSGAALGAMIRRRWARIAPLAHAIHDAPDDTKTPPVQQAKPIGAKKLAAMELRRIIAGWEMNSLTGQAEQLRKVIDILEPKE